MPISLWGLVLWTSGFLANVVLFAVLLRKKRFARFGVFTASVAYLVLRTLALFMTQKALGEKAYAYVYWWSALGDYSFQVAIVGELYCRIRQTQARFLPNATLKISGFCVLGAAIALCVCLELSPPLLIGYELWDARVSIFTSLITCQCLLVLSVFTNRLGIRRGDHILAIGSGLVTWSALALLGDIACAATSWNREFPLFDNLQAIIYVCVTVYWAIALWPDERTEERVVRPDFPPVPREAINDLPAQPVTGTPMGTK